MNGLLVTVIVSTALVLVFFWLLTEGERRRQNREMRSALLKLAAATQDAAEKMSLMTDALTRVAISARNMQHTHDVKVPEPVKSHDS